MKNIYGPILSQHHQYPQNNNRAQWRELTLERSASLAINLRVHWILSAHRWISIFHLPIQPFHQCSAACETFSSAFNPSQLGQKRAFYERGLGLFLALNCPSSYLLMVGSGAPCSTQPPLCSLKPFRPSASVFNRRQVRRLNLFLALDCPGLLLLLIVGGGCPPCSTQPTHPYAHLNLPPY